MVTRLAPGDFHTFRQSFFYLGGTMPQKYIKSAKKSAKKDDMECCPEYFGCHLGQGISRAKNEAKSNRTHNWRMDFELTQKTVYAALRKKYLKLKENKEKPP